MKTEVVVEDVTRKGGPCVHCGGHIPAGEYIAKVVPFCCSHHRRPRGCWVCEACVQAHTVQGSRPAPGVYVPPSLFTNREEKGWGK